MRRWPRLVSLLAGLVMCVVAGGGVVAKPALAYSSVNLTYRENGNAPGGIAVMTGHPHVYLVFVGNQWGTQGTDANGDVTLSGDPVGAAPFMQEMFKGLGTNNDQWSGVLTQYCQGIAYQAQLCPLYNLHHVGYPLGGALAGVWVDDSGPFETGANLFGLGTEAGKAAMHFGNSFSPQNGNIYLLFTPHGTWPDMGKSGFCATHLWNGSADPIFLGQSGSSWGPQVVYGIIPYASDRSNCWANTVNTGTARGPLDAFSINAGHEYAEIMTDPYPPNALPVQGGWFEGDGLPPDEIADHCEGGTGPNAVATLPQNITLATGTFALPALWSNEAGLGVGGCVFAHPIIQGGGIVNGGFETGAPSTALFSGSLFGWQTTGKSSVAISAGHTGNFAAKIGSPGTGDSTISQAFTPANNENSLSFWYEPACSNPGHDWTSVTLVDNTRDTTTTLLPNTCVESAGWVPVSAAVTPGDFYTFTLTNHDIGDANHPNVTYLDDVTVTKSASGSLPPPTGVHVNNSEYLTWTPPNTPTKIAGYVISRDNDYAIAVMPGTATSLQDTWSDGRSHTYQVRAFSTDLSSAIALVSGPVRVAEPPVNVTRASQGHLCWDPVATLNGPNDEYTVYAIGGNSWQSFNVPAPTDQTSLVCWAPDPTSPKWTTGTTYWMWVTALTGGVLQSDASASLNYLYVPPVAADANQYNCVYKSQSMPCVKAVLVTGNAVSQATSYNIYRNGALIPTGLSSPSYWDFNVTVGSAYQYQIIAVVNGVEGLPSYWSAFVKIT